jgi:hypothetical protein
MSSADLGSWFPILAPEQRRKDGAPGEQIPVCEGIWVFPEKPIEFSVRLWAGSIKGDVKKKHFT